MTFPVVGLASGFVGGLSGIVIAKLTENNLAGLILGAIITVIIVLAYYNLRGDEYAQQPMDIYW